MASVALRLFGLFWNACRSLLPLVFWAGTTKIVGAPGFTCIVAGWFLKTLLCTCLGAVAAASSSKASVELLRVSAGGPAKGRLDIKPKKMVISANFRINLPSTNSAPGSFAGNPFKL